MGANLAGTDGFTWPLSSYIDFSAYLIFPPPLFSSLFEPSQYAPSRMHDSGSGSSCSLVSQVCPTIETIGMWGLLHKPGKCMQHANVVEIP
jgi:hypothetical protein